MKLRDDQLALLKAQALGAAREVKAAGKNFVTCLVLMNATPSGELGGGTVIDVADFPKDVQAALQRKYSRSPDIAVALLIMECWHVDITPGEPIPEGSLADHPDRREIMLFNALTADAQYLLQAEITGTRIADADFVCIDAPGPEDIHYCGRYIRQ